MFEAAVLASSLGRYDQISTVDEDDIGVDRSSLCKRDDMAKDKDQAAAVYPVGTLSRPPLSL